MNLTTSSPKNSSIFSYKVAIGRLGDEYDSIHTLVNT